MNEFGKALVLAGGLIIVVGVLIWTGIGRSWLGKLPGDIHYTRGNFNFYLPLATCLLASLILTLLFRLFRK